MIRPSMLQVAENCGLAPKLAADFPESGKAAARGTGIHDEIRDWYKHDRSPTTDEAKAAIAYIKTLPDHSRFHVDRKVSLHDPDTDEVLTEGTLDFACEEPELLHVIDWKTGNPDYITPPDDNLQLHAYAIALALEIGAPAYRVSLGLLDGPRLDLRSSEVQTVMWPMIDRIRKAAKKEPTATPGDHCQTCWQRTYCYSWKARTETAMLTIGNPQIVEMTGPVASELLTRAEQVMEAAKLAIDLAKSYQRGGGIIERGGKLYEPSTIKGRTTADVKALERDGLAKYLKQGEPYERWGWRKA